MDNVDRVVVALASGPGIAAPQMDFFEVTREGLNDADARLLDSLIANADFLSLTDFTSPIRILDGQHKSNITVEMTDRRSHRLAFYMSTAPGAVRAIVNFAKAHSTASPN